MPEDVYPQKSDQYDKIHDNFVRRLAILEAMLAAKRIPFLVTARLRSMHTQELLYAAGRTRPGRKVTNARPGYSPHNWDLAADFTLFDRGHPISDPNHPTFRKFEVLVKAAYLMTGRSFPGLVDAGHVQHPRWKEAIRWKKSSRR